MTAPDDLSALITTAGALGTGILVAVRYGRQILRACAPNRIRYRLEIERADEPDAAPAAAPDVSRL